MSIKKCACSGMDYKKLGRIKEGIVFNAFIQVMAMPDMVFLSVDSYLKKGETRSWKVQPQKNHHNLKVSGKSAQIRLRVEQKS